MILLDKVLDKVIKPEMFIPGLVIFGIFVIIGLILWKNFKNK